MCASKVNLDRKENLKISKECRELKGKFFSEEMEIGEKLKKKTKKSRKS